MTDAYFQRWVTIEFPRRFAEDAHKEAELRGLLLDRGRFEIPASSVREMRGFLRYAVEAVAPELCPASRTSLELEVE